MFQALDDAKAALARGDNDLAESRLTSVIEFGQAFPFIFVQRAQVRLGINKPNEALADLDAAIRADQLPSPIVKLSDDVDFNAPPFKLGNLLPFVHSLRGQAFVKLNDFPSALAAYDEALRGDPDSVEYLQARSRVKASLGDTAGAKADMDAALKVAATAQMQSGASAPPK